MPSACWILHQVRIPQGEINIVFLQLPLYMEPRRVPRDHGHERLVLPSGKIPDPAVPLLDVSATEVHQVQGGCLSGLRRRGCRCGLSQCRDDLDRARVVNRLLVFFQGVDGVLGRFGVLASTRVDRLHQRVVAHGCQREASEQLFGWLRHMHQPAARGSRAEGACGWAGCTGGGWCSGDMHQGAVAGGGTHSTTLNRPLRRCSRARGAGATSSRL